MAILIKLLATKIVASSFFGRSNSIEIIWIRLDFSFKPFSMSVLESENSATSAPEISAEHASSKNNNTKPKTTDTSIAVIKLLKLAGSGSKYDCFSYTYNSHCFENFFD